MVPFLRCVPARSLIYVCGYVPVTLVHTFTVHYVCSTVRVLRLVRSPRLVWFAFLHFVWYHVRSLSFTRSGSSLVPRSRCSFVVTFAVTVLTVTFRFRCVRLRSRSRLVGYVRSRSFTFTFVRYVPVHIRSSFGSVGLVRLRSVPVLYVTFAVATLFIRSPFIRLVRVDVLSRLFVRLFVGWFVRSFRSLIPSLRLFVCSRLRSLVRFTCVPTFVSFTFTLPVCCYVPVRFGWLRSFVRAVTLHRLFVRFVRYLRLFVVLFVGSVAVHVVHVYVYVAVPTVTLLTRSPWRLVVPVTFHVRYVSTLPTLFRSPLRSRYVAFVGPVRSLPTLSLRLRYVGCCYRLPFPFPVPRVHVRSFGYVWCSFCSFPVRSFSFICRSLFVTFYVRSIRFLRSFVRSFRSVLRSFLRSFVVRS